MTGFETFPLARAAEVPLGARPEGLRLHALGKVPLECRAESTYWVLVTSGRLEARVGEERFSLGAGCHLTFAEPATLQGGAGLVIELAGYRGLRQAGGPLEDRGRLRYVDGCTDTLLVCPPKLGEPCLNHLHIPPHTDQSFHTHDSVRVGVIARGHGACRTHAGSVPLEPGLGWFIPAGLRHAFQTRDSALDVFAWHPDSDFGPTDEAHPMINRTRLER